MGFLRNLFKGKASRVLPTEHPVADQQVDDLPKAAAPRAVAKSTIAATGAEATDKADGSPGIGVNIWDFDGPEGGNGDAIPALQALDTGDLPLTAPDTKGPSRARRNKTRIIGFDAANTEVVSLFDAGGSEAAPAIVPSDVKAKKVAAKPAPTGLTLGWLVVVEGAGRGTSFALTKPDCEIGSGKAQSVPLAFGDTKIAGKDHARVRFDGTAFEVTPGAAAKPVHLNGTAITGTKILASGDTLRLGDTCLRFVPLVDSDFTWGHEAPPKAKTPGKETSNVANA